jgi:hypothetical protein
MIPSIGIIFKLYYSGDRCQALIKALWLEIVSAIWTNLAFGTFIGSAWHLIRSHRRSYFKFNKRAKEGIPDRLEALDGLEGEGN